MMNSDGKAIVSFLSAVIGGLIGSIIVLAITLTGTQDERNSLVQQTCDYAQVANTDTVTELCTKYQQQTDTVYLQEIGGNSRVETR